MVFSEKFSLYSLFKKWSKPPVKLITKLALDPKPLAIGNSVSIAITSYFS